VRWQSSSAASMFAHSSDLLVRRMRQVRAGLFGNIIVRGLLDARADARRLDLH